MKTTMRGVVAAGHPATAAAAEAVLREGDNAFDAVVAAYFAACVAEPVLCSLAGGGFLLAHAEQGRPRVYDFFVHTPQQRRPADELDFYPILADFGTVKQEFHIGLGATATPGCVRGLFQIQRDLCTLPMTRLVEPAIEQARDGIRLNDFHAYIFSIVAPIYLATTESRHIFANPDTPDQILASGQLLYQPEQADFLDALAREGEDLFYRGEVAQRITSMCQTDGGYLTLADLSDYQVIPREPLAVRYRNARVFINPPPSSGGLLVAFALDLLAQTGIGEMPFGSDTYLHCLTTAMALTNQARQSLHLDQALTPDAGKLLNPTFLAHYREQIVGRARSERGTTHISVIDADGNLASMTASNGEGCGHMIPGTGVMLNNMLGEEDINPAGFHRWPLNQRMTSMMAPAVIHFDDGRRLALGSGGSNRIRSAMLQVLVDLIDYGMPVEAAVNAPRIHLEGQHLSIEAGFNADVLTPILAAWPDHTLWSSQNLFFGGAHTVMRDGTTFHGAGDPRRGGVAVIV
jgi:gamma-glutamyltranspeptidase/glutathione hydrolase